MRPQRKRAISNVTDSIADIPKPDLEAYERDQDMIDDAEEKKAEERFAKARKRVKRNSRQTLTLLEEVRGIREELNLAPPE